MAAAVTETFLETNSAQLLMTDREIVRLFLDIASGSLDRDAIEERLRQKVSVVE